MLADCALSQMQRTRGGRHAGVIGNRDESAEQRDVEIACHWRNIDANDMALPVLQLVMKAIGSLYPVWLAWKIGHSGPPHLDAHLRKPTGFVSGLWMLWHNPKGWAMTPGAAVSFAALANNPLQLGVLLGLAFGAAAMMSLSLWCFAGLLFTRLLRTSFQWRLLSVGLGPLLVMSIAPMWLR